MRHREAGQTSKELDAKCDTRPDYLALWIPQCKMSQRCTQSSQCKKVDAMWYTKTRDGYMHTTHQPCMQNHLLSSINSSHACEGSLISQTTQPIILICVSREREREPASHGKQGCQDQQCAYLCTNVGSSLGTGPGRGQERQELLQVHHGKKLLQCLPSRVLPDSLCLNMWL
jgi:hypothetical protein